MSSIVDKLGITKSPWKVAKENDKSGLYILGADNKDQVVTGGYNRFNPLGVNEEVDASLIATAPEMLEALIIIANNDILYGRQAVSRAIPVIEKATNKSWEEIKDLLK